MINFNVLNRIELPRMEQEGDSYAVATSLAMRAMLLTAQGFVPTPTDINRAIGHIPGEKTGMRELVRLWEYIITNDYPLARLHCKPYPPSVWEEGTYERYCAQMIESQADIPEARRVAPVESRTVWYRVHAGAMTLAELTQPRGLKEGMYSVKWEEDPTGAVKRIEKAIREDKVVITPAQPYNEGGSLQAAAIFRPTGVLRHEAVVYRPYVGDARPNSEALERHEISALGQLLVAGADVMAIGSIGSSLSSPKEGQL